MIASIERIQHVRRVKPSNLFADHCQRNQIEILKTSASGPVYRQILSVRSAVNGTSQSLVESPIDEHSDLYCIFVEGVPSGTMRVTRAAKGRLDCEDYYPAKLVEAFRDRLGSAGGFCIARGSAAELKLARLLIEAAWIDQIPNGYRLDIINAHERGVRYYQRLGYRLIRDSFFIHPTLGTPSYSLVFRAAPDSGSPLDHVFSTGSTR